MNTVEHPCASKDCMPVGLARWYNFFRIMVAALLAALLLGLVVRGCQFAAIGAPIMTAPAAAMVPGALALTGTGTAGSLVDVAVNGASIGQTRVGADGTWTLDTNALPEGDYEAIATSYDPDGVSRGTSSAVAWTVAAATAAVAVAPTPTFDIPTIALPNDIDAANVALTGTGTPGTTVEIMRNGSAIGTADVGDDGTWQFTAAADGRNTTFEARGIDPDGGDIGMSNLVQLVAPGSAGPLALAGAAAFGTFSADSNGMSLAPLSLSGTGTPGASVEVFANGKSIGTAQVGSDGTWAYSGDVAMEPGNVDLTARMTLADGTRLNTLSAGRFAVPDLTPAPVEVVEEEPEPEPVVEEAEEEAEPAVEEEAEETTVAADASLAVESVSAVGDTPTIGTVNFGMSGTGRPGVELAVFENGVQVGGARVQEDGTWSCTCALPPGEHVLIVQDANDPSYTSEEITFVVENLTTAPTPPSGTGQSFRCTGTPPNGEIRGTVYIIAQCEYADLIAQRLGTTVAELLAYNPQLDSLRLIYPGQVLNIPLDAGCFDDNNG